ncbi:MAG: molybdopterin-dependent oxidoreductase, partial [Janthinobacterium lividum]
MTSQRSRPWLSGRGTNLALLLALLLTYLTGAVSEATGAPRGWWVSDGHGVAAVLVIVLLPWKSRVVRRGLRRARATRWLSALMGVIIVATLFTGVASMTGLLTGVAGLGILWLHIAAALVVIPLIGWHAIARPARWRRTDLSRRTALRAGVLGVGSLAGFSGVDAVVGHSALPGAERRFTGSVETASFTPAAMPATIWLDDTVPTAKNWRLRVVDGVGSRTLSLTDLSATVTRRATLDCTSGWYAEQDWSGVRVADLLRENGSTSARSLLVHSRSGYRRRFPLTDLQSLLLATHVGGE